MVTSLRLLDDAAFVSVDDTRVAGASEVWPVSPGFCDCAPAWVVVEAYTDVGTDGRRVTARAAGHCIECGTEGHTDWLPIGTVVDGAFRPVVGLRRPANPDD